MTAMAVLTSLHSEGRVRVRGFGISEICLCSRNQPLEVLRDRIKGDTYKVQKFEKETILENRVAKC